jgi:hypothetical protein
MVSTNGNRKLTRQPCNQGKRQTEVRPNQVATQYQLTSTAQPNDATTTDGRKLEAQSRQVTARDHYKPTVQKARSAGKDNQKSQVAKNDDRTQKAQTRQATHKSKRKNVHLWDKEGRRLKRHKANDASLKGKQPKVATADDDPAVGKATLTILHNESRSKEQDKTMEETLLTKVQNLDPDGSLDTNDETKTSTSTQMKRQERAQNELTFHKSRPKTPRMKTAFKHCQVQLPMFKCLFPFLGDYSKVKVIES